MRARSTSASEREAGPRPAGLPDRARQPRRGDRADPGADDTDSARTGLMESSASPRSRPRRSSISPRPPDGARAEGDRGRVRRSRGADRRAPRDARRSGPHRRADPGGAARGQHAYGRTDERRTEIVMGEDSLELEDMIAEEDMVIAITRSGNIKRCGDRTASSARRNRRHGHGSQGRGLHRAPLRGLDPRLHPVLHDRREGLPTEGARAPTRLTAIEGPGDREPPSRSGRTSSCRR